MDRRVSVKDKQDELELQTYNLFPERWGELYRERMLGSQFNTNAIGDIGVAFGGEPELPASYDDLNDFYEKVDQPKRMSGGDIASVEGNSMLGFASGPSFWRADA
jgi:hypothetical protein